VKILVFAKFHVLSSIVTCMIVIVLQVLQHSKGLGVSLSFHYFVSILFFWFIDLFIVATFYVVKHYILCEYFCNTFELNIYKFS